jgi:hypothetical protein
MIEQLPIVARATFRDGALYLDERLDLPQGTRVKIVIASTADTGVLDVTDNQIIQEILRQDRDVFQALAE